MSFQRIDHNDDVNPEGKKALLIYGYSKDEISQIQAYGKQFQIEDYIVVNKNQTGLKVGELIERNEEEKAFPGMVLKKTILLNAFSNQALNEFISNFPSKEIKRPIFAVVTETSAKWEFGKLVKELILEHMTMSKNRTSKHK